jgi:flagellar basal body-associated protein FliL
VNGMMNSTGAVIALMVILVLVLGGILIGVRMVGSKAFNKDHGPQEGPARDPRT